MEGVYCAVFTPGAAKIGSYSSEGSPKKIHEILHHWENLNKTGVCYPTKLTKLVINLSKQDKTLILTALTA
jgi:hypothetical protein